MRHYHCSDELTWQYSFKPFLEATSGSYGDIKSKERLIDLFKYVLPKARNLTTFTLRFDSRKAWVTPEAVYECLSLLKHTYITNLTVMCLPVSIVIRDAVYRWLSQDTRLISFRYSGYSEDRDFNLEQYARSAAFHPKLQKVAIGWWEEEANAQLKQEVERIRIQRMVDLIAEPPVSKDILRHIYGFTQKC
jgi:hypothetical protein